MATIVTIAAGDQITNSRADLNTNFANLNSDKIETSVLDTDTSLAANSDSKVATQKAVKAYVDAGGNPNASTTARGIVEEATQAELTAGTQAGGSGARLFLNPVHTVSTSSGSSDEGKIPRLGATGKLAAGFISSAGKIEVDPTETTVFSTTTETTIFDVTVPGGTLSTNNAIRVTVWFDSLSVASSSKTVTLRLKYGGTTVASVVMATTGATSSNLSIAGELVGYVIADGSASVQKGAIRWFGGDATMEQDNLASVDGTKGIGANSIGTGAVDSSSDQTLSVTVQNSESTANTGANVQFWIVEKIS